MRNRGKLTLLLLLALLAALPAAAQPQCRLPQQVPVQACNRHEAPRGQPGDFDFYLLSFSWSPAFCATAAGRRSALQCRDNHFGWVLHGLRSEEHTSELQSLMRISYAVFCLKKKKH